MYIHTPVISSTIRDNYTYVGLGLLYMCPQDSKYLGQQVPESLISSLTLWSILRQSKHLSISWQYKQDTNILLVDQCTCIIVHTSRLKPTHDGPVHIYNTCHMDTCLHMEDQCTCILHAHGHKPTHGGPVYKLIHAQGHKHTHGGQVHM